MQNSELPALEHAAFDYADLAERLRKATDFEHGARRPRVAVLGDYCLDRYLYIYPELDEISVETGIAAKQVRAVRVFPGAAGTIVSNLCALGAETCCFGVAGGDGEGAALLKALRKIGANVDGIVLADEILTPTYTKPMTPAPGQTRPEGCESPFPLFPAPGEGTWIEGARLDQRNPTPIPREHTEELCRRFAASVDSFDAVVVAEQFPAGSEAVFSPEMRAFASDTAASNPSIPFLCDSRFFIDEYRNALIKCNACELLDAARALRSGTRERETTLRDAVAVEELVSAGLELARRNARPALVTRGEDGSILVGFREDGRPFAVAVPAEKVEPPIDICGAGDATNAGFAFARALGMTLSESALIAGMASSITIRQIGVTGVATVGEIVALALGHAGEKNRD